MNGLELYQDQTESGHGEAAAYLDGVEVARLLYTADPDEIVVQNIKIEEDLKNSSLGAIMIQWLKEQNPGLIVNFEKISSPVSLSPYTVSGYLPLVGGAEEKLKKHLRVVFGAYMPRPGYLLLTQRRLSQTFPGKWELPNGRVIGEEADKEALRRAWKTKLGVDIQVKEKLAELDFVPAEGVLMDIAIYVVCVEPGQKPRPLDAMGMREVTFEDAEQMSDLISVTATLDVMRGDPPTPRCAFVRAPS